MHNACNKWFSQSPGGVGTTNLRGWFDASTGVTLTSGAVSGWTDRAGVGNASQTTAGERPVNPPAQLIQQFVLTFDGSNDNLDLADRRIVRLLRSLLSPWQHNRLLREIPGSAFNGGLTAHYGPVGGFGLVALNRAVPNMGLYSRLQHKGTGFAFVK